MVNQGEITLQTKRLEIIPLAAKQLRLWVEDVQALERELDCIYRAEPIEGIFREIVRGQIHKTESDSANYLYHSFWLIVRKIDCVVVGSCDFKDVPNADCEVEIGYGLGKEFEGNGYMTEAMRAFCKWALTQEGIKNVIAETEVDNPKSENVLKRLGFAPYKQGNTNWWRL
jgi:RimJ/RimL family protein N-acetyltransferase